MGEFTKILKSFSLQDTLNPKVWENPDDVESSKMKDKVRKALLKIAEKFIDYLGDDIFVDDITLTGSLANYNWSEYSDFDLHIIIDFEQFGKDSKVYHELFDARKFIFNESHDIKIYGYDVELYAQDKEEEHTSSGLYSIMNDEWLHKPKKENPDIDKKVLVQKIDSWTEKIEKTIEDSKKNDGEKLETLKSKLKEYRKSGLEKEGELSYENLVFKFLRRSGHIEKLFDALNKETDKELSVERNIQEQLNDVKMSNKLFGGAVVKLPKAGGHAEYESWSNKNAWDIPQSIGTPVYSLTSGTVISVTDYGPKMREVKDKKTGNTIRVFGGSIKIQSKGNQPQVFYTHLNNLQVKTGEQVRAGQLLGYIMDFPGSSFDHVHIALEFGHDILELVSSDGIIKSFENKKSSNGKNLSEASSSSSTELFGGSSVRIPSDGSHGGKGWPNNNAWDIPASIGTPVHAVTSGKVINFTDYGNEIKVLDGGKVKVFGQSIKVQSYDGLPQVYYTHMRGCTVKIGDEVECGQLLGYVMDFPGSSFDHLHIAVETGHNIRELINDDGTIKCKEGSKPKTNSNTQQQSQLSKEEILKIFNSSQFLQDLRDFADDGLRFEYTPGQKIPYSEVVRLIQKGLEFLKYKLPRWGVDGKFGPETKRAVEKFQKENDLPVTGVANVDVMKKLVALMIINNFKDSDVSTSISEYGTVGSFTYLDLSTKEGYDAYRDICQSFIDSRNSNAGVDGEMMAQCAKLHFSKGYVPPELACAQLAVEGGLSTNPNVRPRRTKNPFNVGNTDSGANNFQYSVRDGVCLYYSLMTRKYLQDKKADDLLQNFVNTNGNRYAGPGYESLLKQVVNSMPKFVDPILIKHGFK